MQPTTGAGDRALVHMPHAVGQLLSRWLLVWAEGGRPVSGWCGTEVRTYQSFLSVTEGGEERRRLKDGHWTPQLFMGMREEEEGHGCKAALRAMCLYSA